VPQAELVSQRGWPCQAEHLQGAPCKVARALLWGWDADAGKRLLAKDVRQHMLAQVVDFLPATAAVHHQIPEHPKLRQSPPALLQPMPIPALGAASVVWPLEIGRGQRPTIAYCLQRLRHHLAVLI